MDATLNYGPLFWPPVGERDIHVPSLARLQCERRVGGKLELDFIARLPGDSYAYVQVAMSVADENVEEREYRPFRNAHDSWPCYLLSLDSLPEGKDGVRHLNLMGMMARGDDLG